MSQFSTEAIWSQLSSDLRRYLRRRVPDDHVADDLLQDTFMRVHRALGTLRDDERLLGWVYGIARNAVRDYHRRAGAGRLQPLVEEIEASNDPLAELRSQSSRWMGELVAELPETYREAVMLSEIEGLSQQEVADRLGLSVSGAKSRVQRGRALLREILDDCCAFQFDHAGRLMDCDPRPERRVCQDCGEE
jgi:RNA polymerase sigma-70 factor (ECF subfamily)